LNHESQRAGAPVSSLVGLFTKVLVHEEAYHFVGVATIDFAVEVIFASQDYSQFTECLALFPYLGVR